MDGPDHRASLEPYELCNMVSAIRNIEAALGTPEKKPTEKELRNKEIVRKSIVAAKDIKAGDRLDETNLTIKRPGSGISPVKWNDVIGKIAIRDFQEGRTNRNMKKVCVVTGTRAEYGLLKPLMKKIDEDQDLIFQLLVTGSHLSELHHYSYREIEADGFNIDGKIDLHLEDDSVIGISKSMAAAMEGFAEWYVRIAPDLIVVLGDRYEILMAAVAATVARIPLAHLYGGETTEGAMDEAFRHSITKMSRIHFTSTEEYRKRVIQLGEHPDRVFCVGALGVENIKKMKLLTKPELEDQLHFPVDRRTILMTYHPVTLEQNTSKLHFEEMLHALDDRKEARIIFTKANADTDSNVINKLIDHYVRKNQNRAISFHSMGQLRYLSSMKYAGMVAGNSSSGIIEAPSLGIPTVNIGDRQKGRIQSDSVINCPPEREAIKEAMKKAYSRDFAEAARKTKNPYEGTNPSGTMINEIRNFLFQDEIGLKKSFYNINIDEKDNVKK